jgi:hypothetical protein
MESSGPTTVQTNEFDDRNRRISFPAGSQPLAGG